MKKVRTVDAVGMVLCHDLTKIIPGQFKGVAFKKGHIICAENIEELLEMGKEYIYVWEKKEGTLHEDDAAIRISKAAAGENITLTVPREGKVEFRTTQKGLVKVDAKVLEQINAIEDIVIATRHGDTYVEEGALVAACRVIPLVVLEKKVELVEQLLASTGPFIEVKPFKAHRVGLITTGNEVFSGRIRERFGPVVIEKLEYLGCRVVKHILLPDNPELISTKIQEFKEEGLEMIVVTGGMSVDPDDATPGGIKASGAEIITYGTPVFPGAMFLLAYLGDIPIMGLPGCVMYNKSTIFDVLLPRILAGEKLLKQDIIRLGHGGLCLDCPECKYPHCAFAKI